MNNVQVAEFANRVAEQHEKEVVRGLNHLIETGVLVIKRNGPPSIYEDPTVMGRNRVKVAMEVEVVSKHQEVIDRLTSENKELKNRLGAIQEAVVGMI